METTTSTQPKPAVPSEQAIEFAVMGTNGDTKHTWDTTKPEEVDIARETFKSLRAKGYVAFKMNPKDQSKGEQVSEFNAEAGAYIFAPQMRGG